MMANTQRTRSRIVLVRPRANEVAVPGIALTGR